MTGCRMIGLMSSLGFTACILACGDEASSLELPEYSAGDRSIVEFSQDSVVLESDQITARLSASSKDAFEVEITSSSNIQLVAGATRAVDGLLVRDLIVYRVHPTAEPYFELSGLAASGSVTSILGSAPPYAGARSTPVESGCAVWFPAMTVVFDGIAAGEIAGHWPRVATNGSCFVGSKMISGHDRFSGGSGWYGDRLKPEDDPPLSGLTLIFAPHRPGLYVGEIEIYGVDGHWVRGERVRVGLIGRAL